jgi:hypothetical protein
VTPASYWKQVREACDKATQGNAVEAGFDAESDLHEVAIEGGNQCYPRETPIVGGFYFEVERDFYLTAKVALPLALARIEELEAELRDTYGKVKYAFAYVDDDGRRTSEDISPTAQTRIKGVLREHIAAAIGDGCIPGCLCMKCKP